jgi:hypothetical protein
MASPLDLGHRATKCKYRMLHGAGKHPSYCSANGRVQCCSGQNQWLERKCPFSRGSSTRDFCHRPDAVKSSHKAVFCCFMLMVYTMAIQSPAEYITGRNPQHAYHRCYQISNIQYSICKTSSIPAHVRGGISSVHYFSLIFTLLGNFVLLETIGLWLLICSVADFFFQCGLYM